MVPHFFFALVWNQRLQWTWWPSHSLLGLNCLTKHSFFMCAGPAELRNWVHKCPSAPSKSTYFGDRKWWKTSRSCGRCWAAGSAYVKYFEGCTLKIEMARPGEQHWTWWICTNCLMLYRLLYRHERKWQSQFFEKKSNASIRTISSLPRHSYRAWRNTAPRPRNWRVLTPRLSVFIRSASPPSALSANLCSSDAQTWVGRPPGWIELMLSNKYIFWWISQIFCSCWLRYVNGRFLLQMVWILSDCLGAAHDPVSTNWLGIGAISGILNRS